MSLWRLFSRLILRPFRKEVLRTVLTVLAVALGVAVVVAIDLAGQAATGSFHASLESLAGKNDLEISATGGLDERLMAELIQLPYDFHFSPRVEDFASINGKGEAIPFLGLDLIAHRGEQDFRDNDAENVAGQLAAGNTVWVGSQLGVHRGDSVHLLIDDRMYDFEVQGVLQHRNGEVGAENVIVADIGIAQQVTGKAGKLDSIDVSVPRGLGLAESQQILRHVLPSSVTVEPEGSRTDQNRKMLAAFRWNLHVLSYIALVVGAFLIYNTISVSVVRRRAEIGIVRALGATRLMIAAGFLGEALFFGVVGSVMGLAMGRALAEGAVRLVGNTVQSLYVSSQPAPVVLTWSSAAIGLAIGVGVSMLAALAPAIEASRVTPVEAMARGREEFVTVIRSRRTVFWAALMLLVAGLFSQAPPIERQPIFAYVSAMLLVAGTAMIIPNIIIGLAAIISRVAMRLLGVEAMLAMRSLRASIGRTSVMVGALATAVAMSASVGIMVGSFRETVWVWMDNQLKADFYLRPAGSSAADRHPTIGVDIADGLERIPGVAAVDRFRVYPITYEDLPASLGGGETNKVETSASTRFLPGEDRKAILAKLPTGDYAIVSEPFANKHNIQAGAVISLPLAGAERRFTVLGIYYDYSTERGYVVLDRHTLLRYLPDRAASNMAVFLKPGADENAVRRGIGQVISGRGVMVFTNNKLRSEAIAIFDRSFRITYALEAVAVLVAVMGIAGALLALVIDRRREFGLLRFLGAEQSQIRRILLCEAGLLGLFSNGIGLVLGTLLSLLLIFVINKQSFGWTIQFHWPVSLLLTTLTGVYIATVAAALYPARTAMRLNPIEVIHEE